MESRGRKEEAKEGKTELRGRSKCQVTTCLSSTCKTSVYGVSLRLRRDFAALQH